MPQLTIYLDEETARKLDRAAEREKVSRSAFAANAIRDATAKSAWDGMLAVLGTWEDDRTVEEILADIDAGYAPDREHPVLE
ncbi:MAG: CopG family transcriptional regulator [Dehalococcoidia bacterium]